MDLEQLVNEEDMEELVASGLSHRGISEILCDRFSGHRGLSERSVRRYCENMTYTGHLQLKRLNLIEQSHKPWTRQGFENYTLVV